MNTEDIWIFGYGSLVWQPGFESSQQEVARLQNYTRSFCMWSIHYRGTAEKMGLVLALDQKDGTHCDGVAFRVESANADNVLEYLRERELISYAYLEVQVEVELASGNKVMAYTYVINPENDQYARDLSLEEQANIIAQAVGTKGPNTDYLFNVAEHLKALNLEDPELRWLCNRVREINA